MSAESSHASPYGQMQSQTSVQQSSYHSQYRSHSHRALSLAHRGDCKNLDVNRELTTLPSLGYRQLPRPPQALPEYPSLVANTLPHSAIFNPYTQYNFQHVPDRPQPVNRPPHPHSPGQSFNPTQNVNSSSPLGSSQLSSFSTTRHVAINSNSARPQTSNQVFNNFSDLAAHYGIPQSLPPAPRTTPRRPPSHGDISANTQPPEPDFVNLCSNYLTMLSQKPDDHAAADASSGDSAQPMAAPQMSDAETIQTLMEVLKATPELQMSNDFGSEYLTSPLIDSPLDDEMLTTPAMGSADICADILTSPFLGDFHSFGNDYSLFSDGTYDSLFAEPKPQNEYSAPPVLPPNLDEMYSISPATPFLDNSSAESSPQYSNVAMPSTSKRRTTAPTGTRRNITPAALVPIDAPTQPRKYVTPSVTSRKEVPAIFARKRARSQAFGDEEDQLNEDVVIDPSMTEQEQIEAKRRQNTIAARRSRKRKLEYQRELEDNVEQYKRESEVWKSRALTCQALLRSHNIECPPFPDI